MIGDIVEIERARLSPGDVIRRAGESPRPSPDEPNSALSESGRQDGPTPGFLRDGAAGPS